MGSLSNFAEDTILDRVCNGGTYSPGSSVYLALSTTDPGDSSSKYTEPVGNGYARKAITFGAASSRVITGTGTVTFDQATGTWGTITNWAIFDALSGGNLLAEGAFGTSKEIVNGNTPSIDATEINVTIASGGMSNYLANTSLDWMFRNQTFTAPDTYLALTTVNPSDSSTGSTITEPSGNGYARKQVNQNGGASPTWDLAAGGTLDNTHEIEFAAATGSWGAITGWALCTALTLGEVLFYNTSVGGDQTPGNGDTVKIPIGDCDLTIS